ncbi:sensor histidine kinase YkoH [Paenibacillus larvae subsp. larvae]|nr:sensor histidine kinase YkoH [Paenibacillus larvae subsp. larvae]ETK26815.1 sensor histidine kinase [Paenibacillus larvae subsp. larvae DSM 25719]PCK70820.1 two-component sensor histidine kinase YycF-like protein [Paenibacillus larvae subsp. larvae B-3650]
MIRMSIKRRLFISNILMLVMPILLTILMSFCLLLIFMGITGIHDMRSLKYGNLFNSLIDEVDTLSVKWSQNNEIPTIRSDIDHFNNQYNAEGISLAIYKGKDQLYPQTAVSNSVLDIALAQDGKYSLIRDNDAIYRLRTGEYTVILSDTNFTNYRRDAFGFHFYLGIVIFTFLIAVVFLTNRILTRFVFRSIITPIETLVHGVHQIRDGNLTYRIKYDKNDEFTSVCLDFNEMAGRLSEMVNARQKDETNRRELIAGISHDLRTPLTSIKAYIEGIEKGIASTPQVRKRYLETIKSKTHDLEYIINQLFLFSKLDIGEFPFRLEQIDIGKELSSLIAGHIKEYEEKGLTISLIQNVQNVYVEIDVVQFRNVIHNVLENSVKYKIKEHAATKIACRENDTHVLITLTDNGPGVSEEAIEQLFDVFYRSDLSRKNPSKGSGLGLAITEKIIERLGGEIKAENVPDGGLAIVITLPKLKGEENVKKNIDY